MADTEYTEEYLDALRKLTPQQRWETARKLYWSARDLRASVLRSQHPEWSEDDIQAEVKRLFMYAAD